MVEALGHGEQILIFRKGGLDEGPGGFEIRHSRFWLDMDLALEIGEQPRRLHGMHEGLRAMPSRSAERCAAEYGR